MRSASAGTISRWSPRLTLVFNVQGSEMIFLLLVALVILGPEKLPDAIRKFTKAYTEFKKMANGFQGELKQVLDEPMREMRETVDVMREATKFDLDPDASAASDTSTSGATTPSTTEPAAPTPNPTTVAQRNGGLNFGADNPRRQARIAAAAQADTSDDVEPAADVGEDTDE